LGFRD